MIGFKILKNILSHAKMTKDLEEKVEKEVKAIESEAEEIKTLTIDHDVDWFKGKKE